jgi:MFS family permease
MAASLALIPLFDDVWLWFPIRFAIGLFGELIFIAGDIWINRLATEQTRGRLIGVYSVFVHSGFAVGPLAIMWLGSDDWTVLWLGVGIIFLGLVPLVLAGGGDAEPEGEVRARLGHFLRTATTLMFAALMFGLIESSTESLLLVFALGRGLEEQAAAFLLALFILGSIVGPLPAGWLADRLDPLILMSGACLGILITLIALPLGIDEPALVWPTMIAMGTFVSSLYVVAMTMMGRRYRGSDLVGVNTSYVFVWGIGAAVGPGLSGGAMTMVGPNGMPAVGGLLCVLFLAVCGRQIRRELARRQGSAGREL